MWIFVLLCCVLIGFRSVGGFHNTNPDVCADVYIWYADGSVDCKYLTEPSGWGMHNNPGYWCNEYSQTDCCVTCTALRESGIIGPYTTTTTASNTPTSTTEHTTSSTPTSISTTASTTTADPSCVDHYIWYADGSVDCQHLISPSGWGMHNNPTYWCNEYSLTDCCETCKIVNSAPVTTQRPTTTRRPRRSRRPREIDD